MNQKIINITFGVIIIFLVGAVTYLATDKKSELENNSIVNKNIDIKPTSEPLKTSLENTQKISPTDITANWKTYTNTQNYFEIKYPNEWTFREYPDTKSGAGFRPSDETNDVKNEFINIDWRNRPTDWCKTPFKEYVKIAAIQEIENYQSLNSIKEITTNSGLIGYETTWNVLDRNGKIYISYPITYFNDGSDKCGNATISLNNKKYTEIYNQILTTFNFIK